MLSYLRSWSIVCVLILLCACGGGGGGGGGTNTGASSTPSGDNVQAISVNKGPSSSGAVNLAYTTVTVCVPGTSQCKIINNITIDTGSSGLRLLASALSGISLPAQLSTLNHPLANCIPFVDLSHMWGSVKLADVKIGGKTASSTPIQLVGDTTVGTEPSTCAGGDSTKNLTTVDKLGSNGILGIGTNVEDCGDYCTLYVTNNIYYDCPSTTCAQTTATLASQVHNPIALFSSDNNGAIIQLPAISSSGATSVDGWLIFGIGTQSNNALGSATIYTTTNNGYLTTQYKGTTYPSSFVDSGSNGLYFPDSSITQCSTATGFYCPTSTLSLSGTIVGQNNKNSVVNFSVANTESLNGSFAAFNNLGGFYSGGFDWGLPFFYGRKVYTALETNSDGPYIAF